MGSQMPRLGGTIHRCPAASTVTLPVVDQSSSCSRCAVVAHSVGSGVGKVPVVSSHRPSTLGSSVSTDAVHSSRSRVGAPQSRTAEPSAVIGMPVVLPS